MSTFTITADSATWIRMVAVEQARLRTEATAARLLLPFTERAWGHPDAERIMRDGLAFLAEFCDGGRVEPADEPTMLRSAARFLDRNYPTAVAA